MKNEKPASKSQETSSSSIMNDESTLPPITILAQQDYKLVQNGQQAQDITDPEWRKSLYTRHPQVRHIYETVYPLEECIAFAHIYKPWTQQSFHYFTRPVILNLIMHHLFSESLTASFDKLQEESGQSYVEVAPMASLSDPPFVQHESSRLMNICRMSTRNISILFDILRRKDITEAEKLKLARKHCTKRLHMETSEGMNVNIWREPDANPSNILMDKNRIKAANLNRLISHLIPEGSADRFFNQTFLLTYQSFCTPQQLLSKIIERYHTPVTPPVTSEDFDAAAWGKTTKSVKLKACNTIKTWLDKHFYDFNDFLIRDLKKFVDDYPNKDGNENLGKLILKTLDKKQKAKHRDYMFDNPPPEVKVPKNIFSPKLTLLDCPDEELSRQLTLLEHEIYCRIRPPELLNLAWSKPKYKHRASNVLRSIEYFNIVSRWVSNCVVQGIRVKDRSKTITRFVNVAAKCKELNNFNSLLAILAGLGNASVYRLHFTWDDLASKTKKLFDEFKDLTSSSRSHANYRAHLHSVDPPCMPYLGVYLTDLTFTDDGNKDFVLVENVECPPPKKNVVFHKPGTKTATKSEKKKVEIKLQSTLKKRPVTMQPRGKFENPLPIKKSIKGHTKARSSSFRSGKSSSKTSKKSRTKSRDFSPIPTDGEHDQASQNALALAAVVSKSMGGRSGNLVSLKSRPKGSSGVSGVRRHKRRGSRNIPAPEDAAAKASNEIANARNNLKKRNKSKGAALFKNRTESKNSDASDPITPNIVSARSGLKKTTRKHKASKSKPLPSDSGGSKPKGNPFGITLKKSKKRRPSKSDVPKLSKDATDGTDSLSPVDNLPPPPGGMMLDLPPPPSDLGLENDIPIPEGDVEEEPPSRRSRGTEEGEEIVITPRSPAIDGDPLTMFVNPRDLLNDKQGSQFGEARDVELINIKKRELLATIITEMQQYQQVPYNLSRIEQIQVLFKNLVDVDEGEMYSLSLQREPRGASEDDIVW